MLMKILLSATLGFFDAKPWVLTNIAMYNESVFGNYNKIWSYGFGPSFYWAFLGCLQSGR